MSEAGRRPALRGPSWWVRLRVLLAAGLVLGMGATSAPAALTDAAWSDSEEVAASFGAETLPAPVLTRECRYVSILGLGARVRIFWELPEGYALDDVEIQASTSGLGSVLAPLTGFSLRSNTELQSGREYRTDIPTNLLGGLIGGGTELEVAILLAPDNMGGWQSEEPARVASNAGLLIGLGGNCRNLT